MTLICSIYTSPIGLLTIANDGYYVTNILYGNHTNEFKFSQKNELNSKVMDELNEYFDGKRQVFDIPIKFEGTPFQKKVWNEILKIPYGETCSYSEIAEKISRPTAVRAIGNANTKNPIAILIPDHRILNSSGTLAGYNGGVFNKKKLLEIEKNTISKINQKLLTQNKVSSELVKIALSSTDIYEFYYYPQDNVCTLPEKTYNTFHLNPRYENCLVDFTNEKVFKDDRQIFLDSFTKIKSGITPVNFEFRFDDGKYWNKCTLSVAQYDDNRVPMIAVGIIQDITKQKNLELEKNKLTEINTEILSSLNNIFLGVHKLNLITGKVSSIRLFDGVSGFEPNSDYLFNDWAKSFGEQYYHPNDLNRLQKVFCLENVLKNRDAGVKHIEEKFRRLINGSYRWISNNIILNNENFTRDVAIIFQMDVSENYQNNNILQTLCNDYYALYCIDIDNNTYQPIRTDTIVKNKIDICPNGNYQNHVQQYVEHFVHELDKKEISKFMSINNLRISLNKQNTEISKVFRKKVGFHYDWIELKFILNATDNNNMVILCMKNVTEDIKKEFEKNQLLQMALQHTKNLSKSKSEILSKISKEFKTPITAIMGYSTIAKNNLNNPEKVADCLNNISNANTMLLSSINDVLNFHRLQTNNYDFDFKNFKFSEFIQGIVETIIPTMENNNITFNYHMENITHQNLIADIEKIKIILINILSNSMKYTLQGGNIDFIVKELSTFNDNNDVHYQFIIKDNGIGIKKDELDKIFNSFFRGSNSNNTLGMGLGLTISIIMIKLLNGEINIDSEVNKGTTVTINLTLKSDEKQSSVDIPTIPNIKALVVNSNQYEMINITSVLKDLNISSTPLYLGKYALNELINAHCECNDYSIIIIDNKLPDMNYLTLINKIHENMGLEPLKIIVTTFNHELTKAYCNDKVDLVLPKPIFKNDFKENIYNLMQDFNTCYRDDPTKTKPLNNYKCLVIEPNIDARPLAIEIISLTGANITLVDNISQAIETIRKNPNYFDFATINLDMFNIDTFDDIKYIREFNKHIPIMAISSSPFTEDISTCIKKGFDIHVSKPIDNNLEYFTYSILSSIKKYRHLQNND